MSTKPLVPALSSILQCSMEKKVAQEGLVLRAFTCRWCEQATGRLAPVGSGCLASTAEPCDPRGVLVFHASNPMLALHHTLRIQRLKTPDVVRRWNVQVLCLDMCHETQHEFCCPWVRPQFSHNRINIFGSTGLILGRGSWRYRHRCKRTTVSTSRHQLEDSGRRHSLRKSEHQKERYPTLLYGLTITIKT